MRKWAPVRTIDVFLHTAVDWHPCDVSHTVVIQTTLSERECKGMNMSREHYKLIGTKMEFEDIHMHTSTLCFNPKHYCSAILLQYIHGTTIGLVMSCPTLNLFVSNLGSRAGKEWGKEWHEMMPVTQRFWARRRYCYRNWQVILRVFHKHFTWNIPNFEKKRYVSFRSHFHGDTLSRKCLHLLMGVCVCIYSHLFLSLSLHVNTPSTIPSSSRFYSSPSQLKLLCLSFYNSICPRAALYASVALDGVCSRVLFVCMRKIVAVRVQADFFCRQV